MEEDQRWSHRSCRFNLFSVEKNKQQKQIAGIRNRGLLSGIDSLGSFLSITFDIFAIFWNVNLPSGFWGHRPLFHEFLNVTSRRNIAFLLTQMEEPSGSLYHRKPGSRLKNF